MGKPTYEVTVGNQRLFLKVHESIYINGTNYIFLGSIGREIKNIDDVPNISCIYIHGNELKRRNPHKSVSHISRRVSTAPKPGNLPRTTAPGDGRLLKLEIHPLDDELMVRVKTLLIENGVTVGMFKEMYGDNKVDMNNDKSRLERKDMHTCSYQKFKHITQMLGYAHHIELFKVEEEENEDS